MDKDLKSLHDKLDYLTAQLDAQRQREQVLEELVQDLKPAMNGMFQVAVDELEALSPHVDFADVMLLLKRLLRDANLLAGMLAQLESLIELTEDIGHLSQPAFMQLTQKLEQMEHKGYFAFASEGAYVLDRIMTEFDRDDVHALGDNIVTILKTVRSMTQPEIMHMVNRAVTQLDEPINENVSLWQLMRELRDPEVLKGMARILHIVKSLSQEPETYPG